MGLAADKRLKTPATVVGVRDVGEADDPAPAANRRRGQPPRTQGYFRACALLTAGAALSLSLAVAPVNQRTGRISGTAGAAVTGDTTVSGAGAVREG